jgi:hypothetical protein
VPLIENIEGKKEMKKINEIKNLKKIFFKFYFDFNFLI